MAAPPDLPGVRHEYVDAGGLRTHIALAGPQDAPPILLVHGWPQNWWAWRHVIPGLAEHYRVIAPDLRGHGWTDVPATGYAKDRLGTDLLALLDVLGIEQTTWIGHDWGGWIGQLVALRAPERIQRMLALCIPHLWVAPHPRQLALLGYQGPISLPLLGPTMARRMIRPILQSGRGHDRLAESDLEVFAARIPPQVTVAMYRTFLTRELLPIARGQYAHARLEVPTTVMLGGRDRVTHGVPLGPVPGHPRLEVKQTDGVAHWLPEQRPDVVIDWAAGPERP
jgi:pimeloyl-ACP methyl ester carboxylesterase